jgi:hypothetical protein
MKITINKTKLLLEAELLLEASQPKLKYQSTPCKGIQTVDGKRLGFSCHEVTSYGKGTGKFFISTHRARSKDYDDITKVPKSVRKFIASTG